MSKDRNPFLHVKIPPGPSETCVPAWARLTGTPDLILPELLVGAFHLQQTRPTQMAIAVRFRLIEAKLLQTQYLKYPPQFGPDGFLGDDGRAGRSFFFRVSGQHDPQSSGRHDFSQLAQETAR